VDPIPANLSSRLAVPLTARRPPLGFLIIAALFALYTLAFIYRTSFVVVRERYFSLFDDAMVSMRYARNLAHGFGLVWNPGGPRIEGYTNPLWVLYMSAVHFLPIASSKTSLVVQLTAAVLLTINLFVVRAIALIVSDGEELVALGAAALTAAYLPINNWSLQGMEVSVLVVAVSVCQWTALVTCRDERFRATPYVVLGASTLVRPDMAVTLGGLVIFQVLARRTEWRQHLLWGAGMLVCFAALQTGFRLWYYGDPLPNTYYLKMTGFPVLLRVSRGLFVLGQFVWKFNLVMFLAPLVLLLRGDVRHRLLLWMLLVQMAYSVYVGGDAWEYWGGSNRYICIVMPGLFVALSYTLFLIGRALDSTASTQYAAAWRPLHSNRAFAVLIAAAIVCANSIYGPGAWKEALLIRKPLHTGTGDENNQEIVEALRLRSITAPDATIAVVRAGTIPYLADRPSIDLLGKNDARIAREPSPVSPGAERFTQFRPGHVKYDYAYSIGQLQPDIIVQLWEHPERADPFLDGTYTPFWLGTDRIYVRNGSTRIQRASLAVAAMPRPAAR